MTNDTQAISAQLALVASIQTQFWSALGTLESMIGTDLDSSRDFCDVTVETLTAACVFCGSSSDICCSPRGEWVCADCCDGEDCDGGEGILCECGRPEHECAVYEGASQHRDRS